MFVQYAKFYEVIDMRTRVKPPRDRRYFHTTRKMDKKDIAVIKKKIDIINQKKIKKEMECRERKKL